MDDLILKKYCIIVFLPLEEEGNLKSKEKRDNTVQSIKDDLLQLANTSPRFVLLKANFLASFSSAFEPWEIRNIINDVPDRMFFLFEAEDKNFANNLPPNITKHLFGLTDNESKVGAEATTIEKEQNSSTYSGTSTELITLDMSKINESERIEMLNDLFDKGLENLDEKELKLLNLLSKRD